MAAAAAASDAPPQQPPPLAAAEDQRSLRRLLPLDPTKSERLQETQRRTVDALRTRIAGRETLSEQEFLALLPHVDKASPLARKLVELFAANGRVDTSRLLNELDRVRQGSWDEQLRFLFGLYDQTGDGMLSAQELKSAMKTGAKDSQLSIDELLDELVDELVAAVLGDDHKGESERVAVSFEQFRAFLADNGGLLHGLPFDALSWAAAPEAPAEKASRISFSGLSKYAERYVRKHKRRLGILVLFALSQVAMLIQVCIRLVGDENGWVVTARVCGACLNIVFGLVLFPICRRALTFVRLTWLNDLIDFDHALEFHKFLGFYGLFLAIIHAIAHIVNYSLDGTEAALELLFTTERDQGWVAGLAGLTGIIALAIFLVLGLASMSCVRRSRHFEAFYWTHKLYAPLLVLLILHAPLMWKFLIGALVLHGIELIALAKNSSTATVIERAVALPGGTTKLMIRKPRLFNFRPGEYVFIRIPALARFEWHPFTISSAPEEPSNTFTVHIRSLGNWTTALHAYVQAQVERERSVANDLRLKLGAHHTKRRFVFDQAELLTGRRPSYREANLELESTPAAPATPSVRDLPSEDAAAVKAARAQLPPKLTVYVDGPFGSPSTDIFQAEHAVLIGAGIGVTPFASILSSICRKHLAAVVQCPKCNHKFLGRSLADHHNHAEDGAFRLRKVDFFWVSASQSSFEWFLSLLHELDAQAEGFPEFRAFLDMNIFLTAAKRADDVKGFLLQLALSRLHSRRGRDPLTGIAARTHPGKPDFGEILSSIARNAKHNVTVFFCGPEGLERTLRQICTKLDLPFRNEVF